MSQLKELLLRSKPPKNDKESILVFGASKGGESVFNEIRHQYNVLGFVDNNTNIQGGKLLNKEVYAPEQLKTLTFEKIIIASDYHREIKKQLIEQLAINPEKITIFDISNASTSSAPFSLQHYLKKHLVNIIGNSHYLIAKCLFTLLTTFTHWYRATSIRKIVWLDELTANKVKVFSQKEQYLSFPPHFIGRGRDGHLMTIPEIALYHFNKGKVMVSVNAVLTSQNEAVIGRVSSFPIKNSQYDAGFLSAHGTKNSLIKEYETECIEKGVAVIGSNDGNYYHWVIEVLSKFQFISELPNKYSDYPILISKKAIEISTIKEFINCLGVDREFIYLDSCIEYQVKELLYITPPNYFVCNLKEKAQWTVESNFVRESSLQYLRESVLKKIDNDKSYPSRPRVFLARKGLIRDYNQSEVMDLLTQYGFEDVYLEDLNLQEQARLMNNAEYIVGATGAAWTNLIFCKTDTKALCWMAEEIGDFSCFSDLACFSKVDMQYLRYKSAVQSTRSAYYASYTIDTQKIEQWLVSNNLQLSSEKFNRPMM